MPQTRQLTRDIVEVDITDDVAAMLGREPLVRPTSAAKFRVIHHSGSARNRAPAEDGALIAIRYYLETKGMRMPPYQDWASRDAFEGCAVLVRCAPPDWRCFHSGGPANGMGVALALQGNTTLQGVSDAQREVLEYLASKEGWNRSMPVVGHHEVGPLGGSPKRSCPGRGAKRWLKEFRGR